MLIFNRMNDNRPAGSMATLFAAKAAHTRIVGAAVLACLIPFLLIAFYNFMAGDDYLLNAFYRERGFWATQRVVYQWTGRYTSTFLGTLFMKFGWPDHYYFLHTLLLFVGLWGAIFFLLSAVNKCWLGRAAGFWLLALASGILVMTAVYVQAEVSTGFYWFSSAVTYETAFILFLLLAGCLVRRFAGDGLSAGTGSGERSVAGRARGYERIYDAMIFILIVLINGCNEVAALFLAGFLGVVIVAVHYYKRVVSVPLLVYWAVSVATGIVIVLTSGILAGRSAYIHLNSNTSVVAVVPIILFRGASVFYYILKVPLFWIVGYLLYVAGGKLIDGKPIHGKLIDGKLGAENLIGWKSLVTGRGGRVVVPGLLAIAALVFFPLAGVLVVSKGSLPIRALNNLIELAAFGLLFLSFVAGVVHGGPASSSLQAVPSSVVAALLVAGLFASDSLAEAWKSVFSGYFYHSVARDRRQKMEEAEKGHQKTVILEPFDEARQNKIRQAFPHGIFVTAKDMLEERPVFLFREIDCNAPDPGWRGYYHLDSIAVK
jgi:preprotein translocase subunit SecG